MRQSLFAGVAQPEVGFGQLTDTVREGENTDVRIRLGPDAVDFDISGQLVLLEYNEYLNYTFKTSRTVPQMVQDAIIGLSETDVAESEYL